MLLGAITLAIAYQCLTRAPDPDSPQFQASLKAATVVGFPDIPGLRLVDPARFESCWERAEDLLPSPAIGVARLARESARQGVRLLIENSGQSIRSMALVVREARKALAADEAPYLGHTGYLPGGCDPQPC